MFDPLSSASDVVPYGKEFYGPGLIDHTDRMIKQFIQQDHGLEQHKKQSLLTMLNSTEAFDHLLAGAAGMLVSKAIANYADMSPPARTLLSLAGFGVGNIIYNTLQSDKFTTYNPETGVARIKI
jgi:hypothetical protein